jgi:maltose alpha-D-glucosyltransferase / alpha-amylase
MEKAQLKRKSAHGAGPQPLWYKDAIFYEARVRSFYDSDGDGIGDFQGLAEKLDYLQDLGINVLWLLPFYSSPLRDDGYDISDYTTVHPECGTLRDFKVFLREAHRRDIRVVTELVINHTSDQHPWFRRARTSPLGSDWRNFYVWSDTPERYRGTRIIFSDFEPSNWTWDPVAQSYYWHRFYANQPDLNFDSPEVHKAIFRILDFWLDLGVDGLRLDAIPYLYEREGTNCENLPETHDFLRKLRSHIEAKYEDRMLLAEANQWPEEAVSYFGNGDECHMAFHFPIMPRLFMALHMEDRFPIIDILEQTPPIPDTAQWALFLRNHDELTLEMVTDEERDYMYRVYAHDAKARINLGIRRRLAPLLGNDRRRIELMNALLFSLPGTPIIYYGDEIGMGDNFYLGDRNGVRTPMQWTPDRNAGFSAANPQRLYLPVIIDPEYNYETINVEAQRNNPHSLLWWMKRLIALRKRYRAFGRGTIDFLSPSNRKVLAFIRQDADEHLLVVANLSRFVQYVELDLSAYRGQVAVELFGRTEFPPIGELPYLLTLGPHAFYWFSLESAREGAIETDSSVSGDLPSIAIKGSPESLLSGDGRTAIERVLPAFLQTRRWFAGKASTIRHTSIIDAIGVNGGRALPQIALVQVEYAEGGAEVYVVPLAFAEGAAARELHGGGHALIAEVRLSGKMGDVEGVLYDATEDPRFATSLLDAIVRRRQWRGTRGEIVASQTRVMREIVSANGEPLTPVLMRAEQSNTSIRFAQRLILKLYRRLQEGINPDLEIGRFLVQQSAFAHTPPLAGALEYREGKDGLYALALLQGFIPNEGDAWEYALDEISRYLDHALTLTETPSEVSGSLVDLTQMEPPTLVRELLGVPLETARMLGQRTAELHRALASATANPDFAPEPFTALAQRSLYQSMRNLSGKSLRAARDRLRSLPPEVADEVHDLVAREKEVLDVFHTLVELKVTAARIRCHGDYHLGQLLYTGRDFVVLDFEGEPARPVSERRRKQLALRDVAGMIRSFSYAAHTVLKHRAHASADPEQEGARLDPWTRLWYVWSSSAFLKAYLKSSIGAPFCPETTEEATALLRILLLEKGIYELMYELNNRPDWVTIPVRGIRELLDQG